jgi:hypothetical protein
MRGEGKKCLGMRGAPAEVAASDREGIGTPKREGSDEDEDEEIARRD